MRMNSSGGSFASDIVRKTKGSGTSVSYELVVAARVVTCQIKVTTELSATTNEANLIPMMYRPPGTVQYIDFSDGTNIARVTIDPDGDFNWVKTGTTTAAEGRIFSFQWLL